MTTADKVAEAMRKAGNSYYRMARAGMDALSPHDPRVELASKLTREFQYHKGCSRPCLSRALGEIPCLCAAAAPVTLDWLIVAVLSMPPGDVAAAMAADDVQLFVARNQRGKAKEGR